MIRMLHQDPNSESFALSVLHYGEALAHTVEQASQTYAQLLLPVVQSFFIEAKATSESRALSVRKIRNRLDKWFTRWARESGFGSSMLAYHNIFLPCAIPAPSEELLAALQSGRSPKPKKARVGRERDVLYRIIYTILEEFEWNNEPGGMGALREKNGRYWLDGELPKPHHVLIQEMQEQNRRDDALAESAEGAE